MWRVVYLDQIEIVHLALRIRVRAKTKHEAERIVRDGRPHAEVLYETKETKRAIACVE